MQQKPYQIKEKLASSTHVLLLTLKKGFMYFIFFLHAQQIVKM